MSFTLNTRNSEGVVLVEMTGRLESGEAVLRLRESMSRLMGDGSAQFVFDLSGVTYIDSGGLGELISCYTNLRTRRGDLKLLNPTAKFRELLRVTKLSSVFETYEDERQAIGAFRTTASG